MKRRLVDLNKGDSFGELALESNNPRAATVAATLDARLITLAREEYQEIISGVNQARLKEKVSFF